MEGVDRDDLIDLLEQLGSAGDAEVLAAARELHRRVSEADLTWDDLLAWPDEDEDEDEEGFESEPEEDEEAAAEDEGEPPIAARRPAAGAPADIRNLGDEALIDRILGECDLSSETRRDLLDLKADIGRGEFTDMDRSYIRALYERLRPGR